MVSSPNVIGNIMISRQNLSAAGKSLTSRRMLMSFIECSFLFSLFFYQYSTCVLCHIMQHGFCHFLGGQVCIEHLTNMFTILSSRVTSEHPSIQATHPVTFIHFIVVMSAAWERPERVRRVLCTRQSIRVPILMPCVTRLRIYICMAVGRLMPVFKRPMGSLSWV